MVIRIILTSSSAVHGGTSIASSVASVIVASVAVIVIRMDVRIIVEVRVRCPIAPIARIESP